MITAESRINYYPLPVFNANKEADSTTALLPSARNGEGATENAGHTQMVDHNITTSAHTELNNILTRVSQQVRLPLANILKASALTRESASTQQQHAWQSMVQASADALLCLTQKNFRLYGNPGRSTHIDVDTVFTTRYALFRSPAIGDTCTAERTRAHRSYRIRCAGSVVWRSGTVAANIAPPYRECDHLYRAW